MFGFFHIDSRWSLDSGCSIIVVKIHTYSSVDWFISFWQNSKLHFPSLLDSDCLNWIRITKKHKKFEVMLVNKDLFRVKYPSALNPLNSSKSINMASASPFWNWISKIFLFNSCTLFAMSSEYEHRLYSKIIIQRKNVSIANVPNCQVPENLSWSINVAKI